MNRTEFEKSLEAPVSYWQNKSQGEVGALLGMETARMVGFDQHNPHHCHDLFTHTLHVVENLPENASSLLRAAAFFHDIGKIQAAAEKEGRLIFHGHAAMSARTAGPILGRLGYSQAERELILFWILHHDEFITWVLPEEEFDRESGYLKEISPDRLKSRIEEVSGDPGVFRNNAWFAVWSCLVMLCIADVQAQSDTVILNGNVIDTKMRKLRRLERIFSCMRSLLQ